MERLSKELQEKLKKNKITKLTEIQQKSFDLIGKEKDVIMQSPTGTGKTLAYLLPILEQIDSESKDLQALILAPTRELVMQIAGVIKDYDAKGLALPGGANITRQIDQLKKKPHLAVGTPGRILELIQAKKIKLHNVRFLILDEADKLISPSYIGEIKQIFKPIPKQKQTIICSASLFSKALADLEAYLNDPIKVTIKEKMPAKVVHSYFLSKEKDKALKLRRIATMYHPNKAVVFVNHNEAIPGLVARFNEMDMKSLGLHSDLSELKRKQTLDDFRKGKARFLVTTDLFARGMDVDDIDFVFNFDIPKNAEYYMHRTGRTGRVGKKGEAITLVTEDQKLILKKFSRQLQIKIPERIIVEK